MVYISCQFSQLQALRKLVPCQRQIHATIERHKSLIMSVMLLIISFVVPLARLGKA